MAEGRLTVWKLIGFLTDEGEASGWRAEISGLQDHRVAASGLPSTILWRLCRCPRWPASCWCRRRPVIAPGVHAPCPVSSGWLWT